MISRKDEKILRKMLSLAAEPEEALTYDELCGFLFGVAITPEVVMPTEWLPMVFGDEMITVDSEKEGKNLFNTLMNVVNKLIDRFHKGDLSFPFKKDYLANEDDIQPVQDWVYGLSMAFSLRPECWFESWPDSVPEEYEEEYDEDLVSSLGIIHGIADPDMAEELFDPQFEETGEERELRLHVTLLAMLPIAVDTIMEHALALEADRQQELSDRATGPPTIRRETPKIGRNDPCPCGSGKKYKKCCLRKEKIVPIK